MKYSQRQYLFATLNIGANITSASIDTKTGFGSSIQINVSGANGATAGTFTLLASNDNVNFATITSTSQALAAGVFSDGSTTLIYNLADVYFEFVQVKYVQTGGAGSAAVFYFDKGN